MLGDVPASFVALPDALGDRADFLIASPSLPPSGAYRFGARRVVGLARRGDDPTLDELVQHFPDVRFIRLRPTPVGGGRVVARDVTDEIRSSSARLEHVRRQLGQLRTLALRQRHVPRDPLAP